MDLNDEALLKEYRAGRDLSLFKVLVKRHQAKVYSIAFRVLGSNVEAEEVVQDTFLKAHRSIDSFKSLSTFASWLYRIAHNESMSAMRRKQKTLDQIVYDPQFNGVQEFQEPYGAAPVTQLADTRLNPSESIEQKEESQVIQNCLDELPESQRTVLVLHDLEGFSYQEIADLNGTSIGTVRSRLHYGRLKLKELLSSYFPFAQDDSSAKKPKLIGVDARKNTGKML